METIKIYLINRIDKKKNGCWEWKLSKTTKGYGTAWINNKRYTAHRLAYSIFIGPFPDEMLVCHKCDNPGCINPKHLFIGTNKENIKDCIQKKRRARGEKHSQSKLKERDILKIRKLQGKMTEKEIAKIFNIHKSTINQILRGDTWQHVL